MIPNFTSNFSIFTTLLSVLISIPKFNRQLGFCFFVIKRRKKAVEQQELVKNKTKLIKEQKTALQMSSALNINTTLRLPCLKRVEHSVFCSALCRNTLNSGFYEQLIYSNYRF